jgi:hypothetical protein
MVKDRQVKRLWRVLLSGKTLAQSADQANMDEKTARRYRRLGRLPGEVAPERSWRTREDPFAEFWPEVHALLEEAPGLEARTLFMSLQTKYPTKFDDSQLRSFQRGVKRWRATAGPAKEVFFSQVHPPGRLDEALRALLASDRPVSCSAVEELVQRAETIPAVTEVTVGEVDLLGFDDLFAHKEVWDGYEGGCEGTVDGLLAGTALADVSGVF